MKALGQGSIASWIKIALDLIWVVLWIAVLGLVLVALVYGLVSAGVGLGVIPDRWLTTKINTEAIDLRSEASWAVVLPGLLAGAAAAVGGGLVVVDRLKRLFDAFCSNEPFREENADHLRIIWIAMLAMELSRYAIAGLVGLLVVVFGEPPGGKFDFVFTVHVSAWLSIAVLIVLAEVFREGARMREEQELTI